MAIFNSTVTKVHLLSEIYIKAICVVLNIIHVKGTYIVCSSLFQDGKEFVVLPGFLTCYQFELKYLYA